MIVQTTEAMIEEVLALVGGDLDLHVDNLLGKALNPHRLWAYPSSRVRSRRGQSALSVVADGYEVTSQVCCCDYASEPVAVLAKRTIHFLVHFV